jgi:hypothetical protein
MSSRLFSVPIAFDLGDLGQIFRARPGSARCIGSVKLPRHDRLNRRASFEIAFQCHREGFPLPRLHAFVLLASIQIAIRRLAR